ncbi:LysR family transcriptional regulator [Bradyrhizobium sp. 2TAF24]|uniref:LysR family transcriptional regulator n=1 Tax=Bradyrhizobium sp. 2TAF24 TaxID=3233011 RepID=UPI003F9319D9
MTDKKRTEALDWEDIRYFVALVRHNTLSATARALRVNHATVSRRLANLEAAFGQPLFERRTEGFVLNDAGRAVLDETSVMEEAASAAFRRLEAGTAAAGLVRVTVVRSLADGFIAERLGHLLSEHPQLDIELIADSRNLSLARSEADLALRLGQPAKGELLTRRIATFDYGFYASASYAARVAAGETPILIGFDPDSESVPEAAWAKRKFSGRRFAARSNSQMAQAATAAGGYGIALLPEWLARTKHNLVALDMGETPPSRELWLVMRPDIARIPRVRLVADHLIEMFARGTEP